VTGADLTIIVPTRNAARAIGACLDSVAGLGRTIVVDAESDDETRRIAEDRGARVVLSAERSPARQRNEGIDLAATAWVLCVDADERVPAALRDEIVERVARDEGRAGYFIPRVTWYLGRRIRHSGWQRDRVLRLFRRDRGRWRDEALHERVALDGEAGLLANPLEHRSYETLADVLEKLDRYTTWGAREIFRSGRRAGPWQILTHPPARFIKTYVLQAGFRDGRHGAVLASFSAYGVLLRYAKAWEMTRGSDGAPRGRGA
jgi:glycosyltransferase involved in cell wall biosynthesis